MINKNLFIVLIYSILTSGLMFNCNILNQTLAANLSLNDYMQNFQYPYDKVFINTLAALSDLNFQITSFNSTKGEIFAKFKKKELYIVISKTDNNKTLVRITPADGIYDISSDVTKEIFDNLKNICSKKNK